MRTRSPRSPMRRFTLSSVHCFFTASFSHCLHCIGTVRLNCGYACTMRIIVLHADLLLSCAKASTGTSPSATHAESIPILFFIDYMLVLLIKARLHALSLL